MSGRRAAAAVRSVVVLAALIAANAGTVATACTAVAQRLICDGGSACTPAMIAQLQRERSQRAAIEYGREMAQAMDARKDSAALDRGYDLARVLLPNMTLPVATVNDSCSGWTAEDEDRAGQHVPYADAEAIVRRDAGLADDAPVDYALVRGLADRRTRCNTQIRRDLGRYLAFALPPDQVRELWAFLVPRAGAGVPHDAAQDIGGARLLYYGDDGTLRIPDGDADAPPHIAARRERAWLYLANHPNGRAVMSALNQFVAARFAAGREPAILCSAAIDTPARIGSAQSPLLTRSIPPGRIAPL